MAGLTVSGVAGGLVAVGAQPLVGLDGHLLDSGAAAGHVLLAWLCALAPTLALAAIGLLGSVALGRSPMGLLLPVIVAVAMDLAQLLPLPVAVRLALPSYGFIAWIGLFTSPRQLGPLLISVVVSLVWAAVAATLAYLVFLRRDFTNVTIEGAGRRALLAGALPLVGAARRDDRGRRRVDPGHRHRDRAGQDPALGRHRVRPPLPPANRAAAPPRRHRGGAAATAACTKGDGLVAAEGPGTTGGASSPGTCPGSR